MLFNFSVGDHIFDEEAKIRRKNSLIIKDNMVDQNCKIKKMCQKHKQMYSFFTNCTEQSLIAAVEAKMLRVCDIGTDKENCRNSFSVKNVRINLKVIHTTLN